jgi:hypothetical protein
VTGSDTDRSRASFQIDSTDPHELRIEYSSPVTGPDPSAWITVSETSGSDSVTIPLERNATIDTVTVNITELDGPELDVAITARNVSVKADTIRVYEDSDGDGLHDYFEEQTITNPRYRGSLVESDPNDPDTDGDGIDDGDEISYGPFLASVPGSGFVGAQDSVAGGESNRSVAASTDVASDRTNALATTSLASEASRTTITASQSLPNSGDSDGDGLGDSTERGGWSIDVIVNSSGHPYRWNYDGQSGNTDVLDVESDAMNDDTDNDGLSDAAEYHDTHTDPQAPVTYAITDRRQDILEEGFETNWGEFTLR